MLTFFSEQYIRILYTDPQILFFIKFFIKNESYGTIYTFKNYFATVISAINFQFQQNKSYTNSPLALISTFSLFLKLSLSLYLSHSLPRHDRTTPQQRHQSRRHNGGAATLSTHWLFCESIPLQLLHSSSATTRLRLRRRWLLLVFLLRLQLLRLLLQQP